MTNHNPQYGSGPYGYGPLGPEGQPKPKKRRGLKVLLVIVGLFALMGFCAVATSGGGDEGSESSQPVVNNPEPDPEQGTYKFEFVTSDGSGGDVTWNDGDMNIRQDSTAQSGWTAEFPGENKWDVLGANLLVQNQGSGDITCRTYHNGEVILENTSSGLYAVVTCNIPN